jgi:lipopolysaccharide/colanic/teichoic acid biosynthesis glycosyltransferase
MVGFHGRLFSLWRFRTMSTAGTGSDPEQLLTRSGRFLRNYSLDHLPMLINLLKGDLSIVGPRPMEVCTVDFEDPVWQRYFQVKPGLVNYAVLKLGKFWTPSRISDPDLNQELELEYLQKRSARFDLQVFLKSVSELVHSKWNIKARGEVDPEVKDKIGRGLP